MKDDRFRSISKGLVKAANNADPLLVRQIAFRLLADLIDRYTMHVSAPTLAEATKYSNQLHSALAIAERRKQEYRLKLKYNPEVGL